MASEFIPGFFCGLACGILLGFVAGCVCSIRLFLRRVHATGRQSACRLLQQGAVQEQPSKQQAGETPSRYSHSEDPMESLQAKDMDPNSAFVNAVLEAMWPEISGYVFCLIRERVEPALQASLPKIFAGIYFKDSNFHLGQTPVQWRRLKTKIDERSSNEHGVFKCIRLVGDVEMDADCEIELVANNLGQTVVGEYLSRLGPRLDATIGLSHVKLRGRMVLELYQVIPRHPLISGIRAYFGNIPELDLTTSGDLQGILNYGFVKNKIIEAVTEEISGRMVLPQRMIHKLDVGLDAITMSYPRPEGIVRVALLDIHGLHFEEDGQENSWYDWTNAWKERASTRWYVHLSFGNKTYTSPTMMGTLSTSFTEDNILDVTVHDRHSQRLSISLYSQEESQVWGRYQGELLGHCWIPVHGLVNDGFVGSWWPLSLHGSLDSVAGVSREVVDKCGLPGIYLRAEWRPFNRDKHLAAAWLLSDERVEDLAENRYSVRAPTVSDLSRSDSIPANSFPLGAIPTHAGLLAMSIPRNGLQRGEHIVNLPRWSIKRSSTEERDVAAAVLVGVYHVAELPRINSKYWCTVNCEGVAAMSFNGQAACLPAYETPLVLAQRGTSIRNSDEFGIVAVWNKTFVFSLHTPRTAKLSLVLHEEDERGDKNNLGTVEYDVEDLLKQRSLQAKHEERLRPAAGTLREGYSLAPRLRVSLKLWLLGASENAMQKYNSLSKTEQEREVTEEHCTTAEDAKYLYI